MTQMPEIQIGHPTSVPSDLIAFRELCWHFRRQGVYQPMFDDLEAIGPDDLLVVAEAGTGIEPRDELAVTFEHCAHPYLGYGCYNAMNGLHILTDPRIDQDGLWAMILAELETKARDQGIDRLWVRANWLGESLYLAHGFTVTGDGDDDDVLLEKNLIADNQEEHHAKI
jgi:GNAT superfamily N-acetyltransferase